MLLRWGVRQNNCTTQHFTINPTQKLTPTGRRAITQSTIKGLNQDKSTVSCVNHRVLHTLKPEHTAPGTTMAGYQWSNIDTHDLIMDHGRFICVSYKVLYVEVKNFVKELLRKRTLIIAKPYLESLSLHS